MTKDDRRLAEIRDPEGRAVVLLARLWDEKITRDHPELRLTSSRSLRRITWSPPTSESAALLLSPRWSEPLAVGGRKL